MSSKKRYQPAFAVVRLNLDGLHRWAAGDTGYEVDWAIAVLHVHWSKRIADEQAARLNELNAEKGVRYCSQYTRVELSATGEGGADPTIQGVSDTGATPIYVRATKDGIETFLLMTGLPQGGNTYLLVPPVPTAEHDARPQFLPGTVVRCEWRRLNAADENGGLVATGAAILDSGDAP